MKKLAAFQAEPCASTWYGFVIRLGLLVHAWEVHGLLGDRDPFPIVTALALADARLGQNAAVENEVG
jgi:prolipoprotein diacylglyceryltransferase